MNAKNLNPLERHVEKIVLAVAVAGAAVIGYFGTMPVTVPNTEVKAGEVEQQVTDAVQKLQAVRDATAKRTDITPRLANYLKDYKTIMSDAPLKPDMVASTSVPLFAPMQQPIGAGGQVESIDPHEMQVVTPAVPPLKDVQAVATRGAVAIIPPPTPDAPAVAPATPGALPANAQIKDLNWVTISGHIPMADFIAEMNDPALPANQKLAQAVQHAVVYRIEVQRRTRSGGAWSAWEPVAPTKANGDIINIDWASISDADMNNTVAALDAAFQKIAEPDFYTSSTGQPIIPPIIAKPDTTTIRPATPAPAPAPAAGRSRTDNIDNPDAPAPAAPTPTAAIPTTATLRQLPNIPFWFYDENIVPGQEYQYQVRLVMFNPTYRFPLGLQDPKMKNQPTIASAWIPAPGVSGSTVTVDSDIYFFVNNSIGNANIDHANARVGFRIYKWTNSNWYGTEGTAQPGMPINGTVKFFDKDKANAPLDVATGYTLVDVLPGSGGGDLEAILLTPKGDLITRDSNSDRSGVNKKRSALEDAAVKPAQPAPTPRKAPGPVQRSGPTTPVDQNPP